MAFTFPRAMPTAGAARQRFEIQRVDYQSPTAAGRVGSVTAGFPLWIASWSAGSGKVGAEEWAAFRDSLRGSQRMFYGRDLARPYPKAYATSVGVNWPGAFAGDVAGWTVNADRDVVTLALPTGFVMSVRDYIGFRWTTLGAPRRALVRCLEGGVAGAGGVSLTVDPALPAFVPGDAVAYLARPDCLMRQITSDSETGEIDNRLALPVRLTAIQELLP